MTLLSLPDLMLLVFLAIGLALHLSMLLELILTAMLFMVIYLIYLTWGLGFLVELFIVSALLMMFSMLWAIPSQDDSPKDKYYPDHSGRYYRNPEYSTWGNYNVGAGGICDQVNPSNLKKATIIKYLLWFINLVFMAMSIFFEYVFTYYARHNEDAGWEHTGLMAVIVVTTFEMLITHYLIYHFHNYPMLLFVTGLASVFETNKYLYYEGSLENLELEPIIDSYGIHPGLVMDFFNSYTVFGTAVCTFIIILYTFLTIYMYLKYSNNEEELMVLSKLVSFCIILNTSSGLGVDCVLLCMGGVSVPTFTCLNMPLLIWAVSSFMFPVVYVDYLKVVVTGFFFGLLSYICGYETKCFIWEMMIRSVDGCIGWCIDDYFKQYLGNIYKLSYWFPNEGFVMKMATLDLFTPSVLVAALFSVFFVYLSYILYKCKYTKADWHALIYEYTMYEMAAQYTGLYRGTCLYGCLWFVLDFACMCRFCNDSSFVLMLCAYFLFWRLHYVYSLAAYTHRRERMALYKKSLDNNTWLLTNHNVEFDDNIRWHVKYKLSDLEKSSRFDSQFWGRFGE